MGMGRAVLVAAVPYLGKAIQIFCKEQRSTTATNKVEILCMV